MWRQAFFFLRHDITDERLQRVAGHRHVPCSHALPCFPRCRKRKSRSTGSPRRQATLFPGEWRWRIATDRAARCGYDSTAEASYVATGYMALARGFTTSSSSRPDQGGMLYEHRIPVRPDFEVPFAAAFAWLIEQEGVDPDRVAVVGRSFGGYLGPRAAAFEPRVAALVADPGQFDFATRMTKMFGGAGQWRRSPMPTPTPMRNSRGAPRRPAQHRVVRGTHGDVGGRPRSATSSAASSPSTSATVSARFRARR